MKISQGIQYGAACLFELANQQGEFLDASAIASRRKIPPAYAQKILQSLARAGLIRAVKGSGYILERPLSEITVLQVNEALSKQTRLERPDSDFQRLVNRALDRLTLSQLDNSVRRTP